MGKQIPKKISPSGIEALLTTREILIFCGSGGVGKTTVAAAAALAAVQNSNAKVMVLTIDPARRLADALGLESLGNIETRVPDSLLVQAGITPKGELYAAMLDTKASWDDLVVRYAPSQEVIDNIFSNNLYQNITSRFIQSHDYIAMERLFQLHSSGHYDLIILDTPPTRHAVDFLDAPKRMADFFGGRLLRWLTLPYRAGGGRGGRFVNLASRPFFRIADRILGNDFVQDIAEFFVNFQSMYDGFVERSKAVEQLLHDRRTSFVVTTTLEGAPLREAQAYCEQLKVRNLPLGALILNKLLPDFFRTETSISAARVLIEKMPEIAAQLGSDPKVISDADEISRVLTTITSTFTEYAIVAEREAELQVELSGLPEMVVTIPLFSDDVHDLAGLGRVGSRLWVS